MVDQPQTDANPGEKPLNKAIAEFVESRQRAGGGRYAQEAERVLEQWHDQLPRAQSVDDVTERAMRRYCSYLSDRVQARVADPDTGISGRTAHKYYSYVRAFLTYCVEWGYLTENPAQKKHVTNELPDKTLGAPSEGTQTWSEHERQQLLSYADERAHEAIDRDGLDAGRPVRDRALVYLLAYTAVRGAELVAESSDDRRRGIRWSDIDYDERNIDVLGKSQERESLQLPEATHSALRQHYRVQDPPGDNWPVFATRHRPTLAQLEDGEAPPSITTESVRQILQRLCEDGEIDVEGEHEYLKPHGARRGLGKLLYKQAGHEAAQKALRHDDPETTSKMYADIGAGEVAEIVDDVVDGD